MRPKRRRRRGGMVEWMRDALLPGSKPVGGRGMRRRRGRGVLGSILGAWYGGDMLDAFNKTFGYKTSPLQKQLLGAVQSKLPI